MEMTRLPKDLAMILLKYVDVSLYDCEIIQQSIQFELYKRFHSCKDKYYAEKINHLSVPFSINLECLVSIKKNVSENVMETEYSSYLKYINYILENLGIDINLIDDDLDALYVDFDIKHMYNLKKIKKIGDYDYSSFLLRNILQKKVNICDVKTQDLYILEIKMRLAQNVHYCNKMSNIVLQKNGVELALYKPESIYLLHLGINYLIKIHSKYFIYFMNESGGIYPNRLCISCRIDTYSKDKYLSYGLVNGFYPDYIKTKAYTFFFDKGYAKNDYYDVDPLSNKKFLDFLRDNGEMDLYKKLENYGQ